jgi:RNA polymerase sigma-70 factor, ECF subfamily
MRGRRADPDIALAEIERVYRTRLPELRRVAAAIAGSRDAAADVVQEAFARAVRERGRIREIAAIEAWLWRVVVNTAHNHRRGERVHAPLHDELAGHPANGSEPGLRSRVAVAIAVLPERQRETLFLRYYAELDYRTIADVLGIAPGTVAATLHAGRESLRQALSETEAVE